jgi:hypothetical protein
MPGNRRALPALSPAPDGSGAGLARLLERYGQLSPLVVCRRQERYELTDGFKRLGAARTVPGISHLSARLLEADERTAKEAIYGLNRAGGRTRELDRYAKHNENFVRVVQRLQAAFSPTASMSLSRSSTTRW